MDINKAIQIVIDMVPNWYQAECGWIQHSISVKGTSVNFYTERGLTPVLGRFLETINNELERLIDTVEQLPESMAIEIIQESLAKTWLEQHNNRINWGKLFSYNRDLDNRTYENDSVAVNLLIRDGEGSFDITEESHYKLIDPLASNINVYFEVNNELSYRDYNNVSWSDVEESSSYKFLPEFLHPFQQIKQRGDWSAHKTSRGDFIVMDNEGLKATRRKGRWTVYDPPTIKNMIVDIMGAGNPYWVACNLFELMLDLSYKRHGALLIYDNSNQINDFITNKESLLIGTNTAIDPVRASIKNSVENISMSSSNSKNLKKRLLIELASMDGAVIYSNDKLIGFGSMVQAHPDAGAAAGARTTAALSSYHHGCFPVKISTDGDITIYFTSRNQNKEMAAAKLSFL